MQDWLVESLKERIKYFRRVRSPVKKQEHAFPKKAVLKPQTRQLPHTPLIHLVADGEDEASHDRHVNFLGLEYKKSKINKHAVADLMRRTFPIRRQKILEGIVSIDRLLHTYPPLKEFQQVFKYNYVSKNI